MASKDTWDGCVWWLRLISVLPIPKVLRIGDLILKQERIKYRSAHVVPYSLFPPPEYFI